MGWKSDTAPLQSALNETTGFEPAPVNFESIPGVLL